MSKLGAMMMMSRAAARPRRGKGDSMDVYDWVGGPWVEGYPGTAGFGPAPWETGESILPTGGGSPILGQAVSVGLSALERWLARIGLGGAATASSSVEANDTSTARPR